MLSVPLLFGTPSILLRSSSYCCKDDTCIIAYFLSAVLRQNKIIIYPSLLPSSSLSLCGDHVIAIVVLSVRMVAGDEKNHQRARSKRTDFYSLMQSIPYLFYVELQREVSTNYDP